MHLPKIIIISIGWAISSFAWAQAPAMHMGSDWRTMSIWDCKNKAAQAMQDNENFLHTDRSGDQTWGYNEKTIVLVSCVSMGKSVYILVAAASQDSAEAERIRNSVRSHVFDAPAPAARYPDHYDANSIALGGERRSGHPPAMHWGSDYRPKSIAGCVGGARLAMSRMGLQSSVSDQSVVWGSNSELVAFVDCAPMERGVYIHVVVAAADTSVAERYRNEIRQITFNSIQFDEP